MRTLRSRIAVGAVISAAVLTFVSSPARADSAITLPLTAAADVVVAGTKVFVSGGDRSTQVVVTSADGVVKKTIGGLNGPSTLLADTDGTKVYVVQQNVNVIAVIDVASAKVTASYATGAGVCPRSLAQSGHYLYFGYNCAAGGNRKVGVGRIDLTAPAAPVLKVTGELSGYSSTPLLTASGGVLATVLDGQDQASTFAVGADGSLTPRSTASGVGGNTRDLALTPDGAQLYTASGYPYSIEEYSTADLTQHTASFPTTPYPDAVAVSPNGVWMAGGSDASYDPDVWLFKNGQATKSVELGGLLVGGGLAWAKNGKRLYALVFDVYTTPAAPPVLHVLDVP